MDESSTPAANGSGKSLNNPRDSALLDAFDEGFCIIEVIFEGDAPVDYRFLEVNQAFEQQTGIVAAVGRSMREIEPQHERHWFEIYGRVARTGRAERFENRAHLLGDRWFDVFAFKTGAHIERLQKPVELRQIVRACAKLCGAEPTH